MSTVNYCWRVLATGLCFLVFGIGCLLLTLCVLPCVSLLNRNPVSRAQRLQGVVHTSFRFFVGLMCVTGILRLTVECRERLRTEGGVLVIANHPSLIDVVVLISLFPALDCIVKAALWRNPFIRGVVRAVGYISNDDPALLLQQCTERLQNGNALLVFPEGTRSRPGEPLHFQRGAAQIAVRSGASVLPVFIEYRGSGLGKGDKWYKIPRPGPVELRVWCGDVLPPFVDSAEPAVAARHLTAHWQAIYRHALESRH